MNFSVISATKGRFRNRKTMAFVGFLVNPSLFNGFPAEEKDFFVNYSCNCVTGSTDWILLESCRPFQQLVQRVLSRRVPV